MVDSESPFSELARHPVSELPEPSERVRLRNKFGISQGTLADKMGVARRTIYSWEHGLSEPHGRKRVMYAEVIALWQSRERETSEPDGK